MPQDRNNTAITVNPYTSTVPMVSIPPDVMQTQPAQPLQGEFGKKGTGALAIGDALVKGFMQGHAYKEIRKQEQAEAQINVAQTSEKSAWQAYQDAIAQGKADPKNADDHYYQAYIKAHQATSDTMAKYTIPEKPTKQNNRGGQQTKKKEKAEGQESQPQTFGQRLKDFFEANPHIVPQFAIATRMPLPPGIAPETQANQIDLQRAKTQLAIADTDLQEAQERQKAEKVYYDGYATFGNLNPDEIAALPASDRAAYNGWLEARARVVQGEKGTTRQYQAPDGKSQGWFVPGTEPAGWQPYNRTAVGRQAMPGSKAAYFESFARENGTTAAELPVSVQEALTKRWNWLQARNTTTSTTVAPGIDTTKTTSSRSAGSAPPLPQGWKDPYAEAFPSGATPRGGMAPPPPAGAATTPPGKKTTGGMQAPPPPKYISKFRAQDTQKVNDQKAAKYQKARDTLNAALLNNQKNYGSDPTAKAAADKMAQDRFKQDTAEIEKWYNQQVHAIGGTVPGDLKVNLPNGQTVTFKTKEQADSFRRAAGLQSP